MELLLLLVLSATCVKGNKLCRVNAELLLADADNGVVGILLLRLRGCNGCISSSLATLSVSSRDDSGLSVAAGDTKIRRILGVVAVAALSL
jgi:hypothetical protein